MRQSSTDRGLAIIVCSHFSLNEISLFCGVFTIDDTLGQQLNTSSAGPDDQQAIAQHATRAIVLVPVIVTLRKTVPAVNDRTHAYHKPEERLSEAVGLAQAIELHIIDQAIISIHNVRPATLIGAGKVEEIASHVKHDCVDLVIVDHALSPIQQRNLERAWNAKVLDRTGLILEIFGRRARTREGRLQVELAHLTFQRSRLVRSWTHLERQRGGFGFLGGPGETQIETDRRLLQDRINKIQEELVKVARTRDLHRKGRRQVPYPIVAIVGYTNAGKSTMFNHLTDAGVLAKDQVFATLDPTMRELALDGGQRIIVSDTVGFISDLPTMLIAAFRATLEEVIEADLILHVRDIQSAESEAQRIDVEKVLAELSVVTDGRDCRITEVWNKIDLVDREHLEVLRSEARRRTPPAHLISAVTGEGLPELCHAIASWLGKNDVEFTLILPPEAGRMVHWLHENARILSLSPTDDGGVEIALRLSADRLGRLDAQLKAAGISRGRAEDAAKQDPAAP